MKQKSVNDDRTLTNEENKFVRRRSSKLSRILNQSRTSKSSGISSLVDLKKADAVAKEANLASCKQDARLLHNPAQPQESSSTAENGTAGIITVIADLFS